MCIIAIREPNSVLFLLLLHAYTSFSAYMTFFNRVVAMTTVNGCDVSIVMRTQ